MASGVWGDLGMWLALSTACRLGWSLPPQQPGCAGCEVGVGCGAGGAQACRGLRRLMLGGAGGGQQLRPLPAGRAGAPSPCVVTAGGSPHGAAKAAELGCCGGWHCKGTREQTFHVITHSTSRASCRTRNAHLSGWRRWISWARCCTNSARDAKIALGTWGSTALGGLVWPDHDLVPGTIQSMLPACTCHELLTGHKQAPASGRGICKRRMESW